MKVRNQKSIGQSQFKPVQIIQTLRTIEADLSDLQIKIAKQRMLLENSVENTALPRCKKCGWRNLRMRKNQS